MENYKTAISCDAGNIQINETHIKYEIHAVHKYVGIFQRLLSLNWINFFHVIGARCFSDGHQKLFGISCFVLALICVNIMIWWIFLQRQFTYIPGHKDCEKDDYTC